MSASSVLALAERDHFLWDLANDAIAARISTAPAEVKAAMKPFFVAMAIYTTALRCGDTGTEERARAFKNWRIARATLDRFIKRRR